MNTTHIYSLSLRYCGAELSVGFDDTEEAYAAFGQACELAEAAGLTACDLIWVATGEVVASYEEEDDESDFDEADLECGFNPYEGCYDWDC